MVAQEKKNFLLLQNFKILEDSIYFKKLTTKNKNYLIHVNFHLSYIRNYIIFNHF